MLCLDRLGWCGNTELLFVTGSLAFLGFRGNFKPSWIKLFTGPAGHGLIQIEKYIPLQLEEYGCARAIKSRRKDLELLKKATRYH